MLTHFTVLTLANSIIGVSVLAMPFCFKQCGVVLATIMLILSAIMTRIVCYFLLKAGTSIKRWSYEQLAFKTFGPAGKFIVEITIIGYLVGTLIAFMVVMGDLGPQIVSEIFDIQNNGSLRTVVMTGLSLFVALPLGLLRNIDSLSSVSALSFLFYFFLAIKIIAKGIGPLWSGELVKENNFFRPEGVLQCIPIIAMALSCQTQIFAIYDSLPDPTLAKMNEIVRQAVNLCTAFYFSIGLFGYTGFLREGISGNILLSFDSSGTAQLIKLCFVMSIAMSFPLCIFPCRASLHSLIFRGSSYHHIHDLSTNFIPEGRLRLLTVSIIGVTLTIGLMIPNIELVLGLVGSTAGSIICIILPSLMFIRVTNKSTTERLVAQFIFCIGIIIMVLTTYVTLNGANNNVPETSRGPQIIIEIPPELNPKIIDSVFKDPPPQVPQPDIQKPKFENLDPVLSKVLPIIPIASSPSSTTKAPRPVHKVENSPVGPNAVVESKNEDQANLGKIEQPVEASHEIRKDESNKKEEPNHIIAEEPIKPKEEIIIPEAKGPEPVPLPISNISEPKKEKPALGPEEFLKKLEETQVEQKKLIEEQKVLLAELKQHHEVDHHLNEAKVSVPASDSDQHAKEVLQNLEGIAQMEVENLQKIDDLKEGLKLTNMEQPLQRMPKMAIAPPFPNIKLGMSSSTSSSSPQPPLRIVEEVRKDKPVVEPLPKAQSEVHAVKKAEPDESPPQLENVKFPHTHNDIPRGDTFKEDEQILAKPNLPKPIESESIIDVAAAPKKLEDNPPQPVKSNQVDYNKNEEANNVNKKDREM